MKAAIRTRYGPPEVVRLLEVARPAPGNNELLFKIHATTVNRTDCHYRSGRPWIMRPLVSGLARPRARVLGNEFAGQVVGPGVPSPRFRSATGYSVIPRGRSGLMPNTW